MVMAASQLDDDRLPVSARRLTLRDLRQPPRRRELSNCRDGRP